MAIITDYSKSTPAFILLYTNVLVLKRPKHLKPTTGDMQYAVILRMAEHAGHTPSFEAISNLDWCIRRDCKQQYRFALLEQLATMPLTDVLELNYLVTSKKFFKHVNKYNTFYKALKIKNFKNRNVPIEYDSSNIVPAVELAIRVNHVTINTLAEFESESDSDPDSNFLLDFGFVESVGSVLQLLKVC
jgi:hypothetical protein